jgi:hypothetical protein
LRLVPAVQLGLSLAVGTDGRFELFGLFCDSSGFVQAALQQG